jgi:hypothetical protein
MDFSDRLENLKAKAAETAATVQAAAAEDRDQLKQRIDQGPRRRKSDYAGRQAAG